MKRGQYYEVISLPISMLFMVHSFQYPMATGGAYDHFICNTMTTTLLKVTSTITLTISPLAEKSLPSTAGDCCHDNRQGHSVMKFITLLRDANIKFITQI